MSRNTQSWLLMAAIIVAMTILTVLAVVVAGKVGHQ